MLKLSDAGMKDGWIEREEKLCVISIEVVRTFGHKLKHYLFVSEP